jgi:hypothetical protein
MFIAFTLETACDVPLIVDVTKVDTYVTLELIVFMVILDSTIFVTNIVEYDKVLPYIVEYDKKGTLNNDTARVLPVSNPNNIDDAYICGRVVVDMINVE